MNTEVNTSKTNMDNVQTIMDIMDTARRASADTERVMGEILDEKSLIAEVRTIYEKNGFNISEADLKAGVLAMKERRFEFQNTQPGLMQKIAHLYITRQNWSEDFFRKALTTSGMVFAVIAIVFTVNLANLNMQKNEYKDHVRDISYIEKRGTELNRDLANIIKNIPEPYLSQPETQKRIEQSGLMIEAANNSLKPALPIPSIEEVISKNADLKNSHQLAKEAADSLRGAKKTIEALALQESWTAPSLAILTKKAPEYLATYQQQQAAIFMYSWDHLKFDETQQIENTFGKILNVAQNIGQKEQIILNLQNQDNTKTVLDQISEAKTLLSLGRMDQAMVLEANINGVLNDMLKTYTYNIVSKEGEISLFTRKLSGNSDAKAYYALVNVTDVSGTPIEINIFDSELQKSISTSKFGIRIPESTYEKIKEDKMQDGIVDNALLAEKKVGELTPTYLLEVQNGAVSRW